MTEARSPRTTVYFVTNRRWPPDGIVAISPRDPTALSYGRAFVSGNSIGYRDRVEHRRLPADYADELANAGRNLLFFIHGFDHTFDGAIIAAAENQSFFRAAGNRSLDAVPIVFSWPSAGILVGFPFLDGAYFADQRRAGASGPALMRAWAALEPTFVAARQNGQKIILLAHSMGCIALAAAVGAWFQNGQGRAELFDLAIIAAGDCDADAFADVRNRTLRPISAIARQSIVLFSHADSVLGLSFLLNDWTSRLGEDGPHGWRTDHWLVRHQTRVVDCSDCRDYPMSFAASHQYYCRSALARLRLSTAIALA